MKLVFFGTPYYVIPILDTLHKSFREKSGSSPIAAVVTQSPKPTGRKQILEFSEVDSWAHKKEIPKLFDPQDLIKEGIKADVGILASYGGLIPKSVIEQFPYGILVIHPSLLPEFRWASPVPAAIVTNTNPTGASIIKMDEKWDHGPVLAQFKEEITENDTYGSLRDRLFDRSKDVLVQMLPAYLKGKIKPKSQDDEKASFARIIKKEDAFIPPNYLEACLRGQNLKEEWKIDFIKVNSSAYRLLPTPNNLYNFIRAMDPWPTAWTLAKIKNQELRMKLQKAHIEDKKLILDQIQLEGKNAVSWEEFTRGYPNFKF